MLEYIGHFIITLGMVCWSLIGICILIFAIWTLCLIFFCDCDDCK